MGVGLDGRPMRINLSHEEREKAALSVGASGEWMGGVGLNGRPSSLAAPLKKDHSNEDRNNDVDQKREELPARPHNKKKMMEGGWFG